MKFGQFFLFVAAGIVPLIGAEAHTVYYVRSDGGTGKQCTGTADAPYPGHGNNVACAWSNPVFALKNTTTWKSRGATI